MISIDGYGVVNGLHQDIGIAQQMLIDNMLKRIKQGWIPQGGVCLTNVGPAYVYSQAIVLPRDRKIETDDA